MAITPLPTPVPSRADPANFAARADAFLGALPNFATEANQLAFDVNQDAVDSSAARDEAVTAADAAVNASQVLNFAGPYNAGTTYAAGQTVQSGGMYYVSLQNSNTGNTPQGSPAWWANVLPMVLPTIALGSSWNIDCNTAVDFTKTVAGNGSFTISNVPAAGIYSFFIEISYTSGTITLFSGYTIKWPVALGGSQPSFTGGRKYKLALEIRVGSTVIDVVGMSEYA